MILRRAPRRAAATLGRRMHPADQGIQTAERFHSIDALRALAMFLGVVLHACLSYIPSDNHFTPVMDRSRWAGFEVLLVFIHAFRMQLFFLVAGFFTALLLTRRSPARFAWGRAVRIVMPLTVAGATIVPLTIWPFYAVRGAEPTFGQLVDSPCHLWFLQYLMIFSAFAWAAAEVATRFRLHAFAPVLTWLGRTAASPWALVPMTFAITLFTIPMSGFSIDPPMGWRPVPSTLAYYGFFFALGWGVQRAGTVAQIGRAWKWLLPVSIFAVFPMVLIAMGVTLAVLERVQANRLVLELVTLPVSAMQAFFCWGMIASLFGVVMALCSTARPWLRWLADSSYWVYLVHLPLIYWLQVWLAQVTIPGLGPGALEACAKCTIALAITLAISLATYALVIRPTPLERVVGGGRGRGRARTRDRASTADAHERDGTGEAFAR